MLINEEFKRYMIVGDNGDKTCTVIIYAPEDDVLEEERLVVPIDFQNWVDDCVPGIETKEQMEEFLDKNMVHIPNELT